MSEKVEKKTAEELKELMDSLDTNHQKEMIVSLGEFSKIENKKDGK